MRITLELEELLIRICEEFRISLLPKGELLLNVDLSRLVYGILVLDKYFFYCVISFSLGFSLL